MKRHERHLKTAFAMALGTLCSAGAPCCGDGPVTVKPGRVYTRSLPDVFDAGVEDGGSALDAGLRRLSATECEKICGPGVKQCDLVPSTSGGPPRTAECHEADQLESYCSQPGGRRFRGYRRVGATGRNGAHVNPSAVYFATLARLEAASIHAFEILARDLAAHGAPSWMLDACARAACDERRHARAIGRWAARAGASPTMLEVPRPEWRARSLAEIAVENVAEGCVRETFGALLAWHQAEHAESGALRRTMQAVARDETRHAALAHAVHEWSWSKLTERERRRVALAERRARARLTRERGPNLVMAHALGLPSSAHMGRAARELFLVLHPLSDARAEK